MQRLSLLLTFACLFGCATQQSHAPKVVVFTATSPDAVDLVALRTLVPDLDLDMRYASVHNFTGAPVDGYEAPKCFLLRPAAEALAQVERDLRAQHMRLRVYDCYRPVRAVQRFVAWAH